MRRSIATLLAGLCLMWAIVTAYLRGAGQLTALGAVPAYLWAGIGIGLCVAIDKKP